MFEIKLVLYLKLEGKNLFGHQQGETLLPVREGLSSSACWLRQLAKKKEKKNQSNVLQWDRPEAGAANLVGAQCHRDMEWFGLWGTSKVIHSWPPATVRTPSSRADGSDAHPTWPWALPGWGIHCIKSTCWLSPHICLCLSWVWRMTHGSARVFERHLPQN